MFWGALTPRPATTGKLIALRKHSQAPDKVNGVVELLRTAVPAGLQQLSGIAQKAQLSSLSCHTALMWCRQLARLDALGDPDGTTSKRLWLSAGRIFIRRHYRQAAAACARYPRSSEITARNELAKMQLCGPKQRGLSNACLGPAPIPLEHSCYRRMQPDWQEVYFQVIEKGPRKTRALQNLPAGGTLAVFKIAGYVVPRQNKRRNT